MKARSTAPRRKTSSRTGAPSAHKALSTYRAKRDFETTPEPEGATEAAGHRLTIQHHFATRDHYDLRLEVDGVLKSWAVTRGPSANPKDKRLAVRTEDHPLDYATFEGLIPKGAYGGGTVILWENTTFTPLNGDAATAIHNGEIKFIAHGARMRGCWVLVRMATREKRENWLLIKERDEFAEDDDSLVARFPESVSTERSRRQIEQGSSPSPLVGDGARAKKPALPAFIPPQLCTPGERAPDGADWLHEVKYDGYRLQLAVSGDEARLYTRTGLDWTRKFGAIAADARRLPCKSALIDGEAIVMNAKGLSDFPALVGALEQNRAGDIALAAFDLLSLDGKDLRALPLEQRKAKLRALLIAKTPNIRYADHVAGDGAKIFEATIAAGGEGIVAKRRDAPYRSGHTSAWLKIKGYPRTDVIVIGYMPSAKTGTFASLHAAVEDGDALRYVGGIGTGFSDAARTALFKEFSRKTAPRMQNLRGDPPRGLKYLAAPRRAEIRFGGWTGDGLMRQARFLALRDDLPMKRPSAIAPVRAKPVVADKPVAPATITHPDRVVFTEDGITKGEIAAYYDSVADRMARHLDQRPLSIVRAPETIGETFFQRHPLKGMTRGIIPVEDGPETYLALDGALGLRTAAQFGAIELHGWMSRIDAIDNPDRMVFDLDPDEALPFAQVRTGAREIADHLEAVGLKSWPMISGGKGVHVVVPLDRTLDYDAVEIFARGLAQGLARQSPQLFVANMSKARRTGKIFIDWLRNKKSATAILPWSLRARKGASVAVPLTWETLKKTKSAAAFTIRTAPSRDDPWDDFFATKQTIPAKAVDFMRKAR